MPINLLSEKGIIKKSLSEKYEDLIQRSQFAEYLNNHVCDWFKKTEKFILYSLIFVEKNDNILCNLHILNYIAFYFISKNY